MDNANYKNKILMVNPEGFEEVTLAQLLPHSFSPSEHMGI